MDLRMRTEPEMIPVNPETKPSAEVIHFVRESNRRRLRKVNEADLLRALQHIRPEP